MNKQAKIYSKFSVWLVICLLFLIFVYYNLIKELQRGEIEFQILGNHVIANKINLSISKIDKEKDWEIFNQLIYFKRSGAFYFVDLNLVRVFLISKSNTPINVKLVFLIKINDEILKTLIEEDLELKTHDQWGHYSVHSLNAKKKFFSAEFFKSDDVKLQIYVVSSNDTLFQTKHPINVKIKNFYSKKKIKTNFSSAICSKCYYLKSEKRNVEKFEWWFELNKQIGYEKIMICNNSIEYSNDFNNLFKKYDHLVEVTQMQQVPDFISINSDVALENQTELYINSFLDLKLDGNFFIFHTNVLDILNMNECYLNNVDQFDYITIIDFDEIILPVNDLDYNTQITMISELQYNFENKQKIKDLLNISQNSSSTLESYLRKLRVLSNDFKNYQNFHFQMAFYLKDSLVKNIIEAFESRLSENKFEGLITINVMDSSSTAEEKKNFNYTFTIENKNELNYAIGLCKIYRLVFDLVYSENTLSQLNSDYTRFFYLSGEATDNFLGKTIHNTLNSLQLTHHYPIEPFHDTFNVPFTHGHDSHFRQSYTFKNYSISVRNLFVDLNYFYNYFGPIYKNLFNKNLF